MRLFYGKKTHIVTAILGFAVSSYAIYWLGRSDQVQQIVDIVVDRDAVLLNCHDDRSGKIIPIYMSTD